MLLGMISAKLMTGLGYTVLQLLSTRSLSEGDMPRSVIPVCAEYKLTTLLLVR